MLSISRCLRVANNLRLWIPDHLQYFMGQVVDINRNRRQGFSDDDHLDAAIEWLKQAQDVTGDGGVSGRYELGKGNTSSYPETTGYIIPTLLKLAEVKRDPALIERAERCVKFLLGTQLDSGAFPGGEIAENRTAPSPFNSAQILHGLLAWSRHANDQRVLDAACRAADWMISVQDPDGAFRKHYYEGIAATYSAHASCWVAELGVHTGNPRYLQAATQHLNWVLEHFDESKAWFDLCGFRTDEHQARIAVSHTIAYTIFGVLYMSQLLGREDGIRAARIAALGALRRAEIKGSIPGMMEAGWRSASSFTCLTGNAQLALIWFRLFELDRDIRYVNTALKAIDEVKRAQLMWLNRRGLKGGIPGSFPLWGNYLTFSVPNWAAKFFIDALLLKKEIMSRLDPHSVVRASRGEQDREVRSFEVSSSRLPAKPKVILYTSPTSEKPARILNESAHWGFSPAAIIVETGAPVPSLKARLIAKLREDGAGAAMQSVLRKGGIGKAAAEAGSEGASLLMPQELCSQKGIPVWVVPSINSPEALRIIAGLEPDIAVHAGAGILRKPVLDIPKYGTLNAHMGILPFYRGMNVTEWAALTGDRVGCTVHQIDPGIDTGAILATRSVPVKDADNIEALRDLVDKAQLRLLADVLEWCVSHQAMPVMRTQTAGEGLQFFRMHEELKQVVENSLASSQELAAVGRSA